MNKIILVIVIDPVSSYSCTAMVQGKSDIKLIAPDGAVDWSVVAQEFARMQQPK